MLGGQSFVVSAHGSARRGPRTGSAAVSKDARRRSGASPTAPVVGNKSVESNVNKSWTAGKSARMSLYWLNLKRRSTARYYYQVIDLLFSFAVFAVTSLLLPAVFRCFFCDCGLQKTRVSAAERGLAAVFSPLSQRYQRAKRGLEKRGRVERYARPAQQGSQTNARIIAPPKQGHCNNP